MGPAIFLASPASAYVTGELLVVDGVSVVGRMGDGTCERVLTTRALWQKDPFDRAASYAYLHLIVLHRMHTSSHGSSNRGARYGIVVTQWEALVMRT